METIAWGYIEKTILSAWFPGMTPEQLKTMSLLEEKIRLGGKSQFVLRILLLQKSPYPKLSFLLPLLPLRV